MKLIVLSAVAVTAALIAAGTSGARSQYQIPHKSFSQMSKRETVAWLERQITHDRYAIRWLQNHLRSHARRAADGLPIRWREDLRWFRVSLRIASTNHARLTRELARPAPAGHWSLWSCITNGAYPGAAHEGNGYNGRYTGPLGMTTPWAGHYPTGSDWVHTPIAVVYSYAEMEYAKHHYSRSWLLGQWPNTAPPCVG